MSSSTTQSTKQWSKVCLASAHEKVGGDDATVSDVASLTALAVAAIEQLTTLLGAEESFHEDRRELKRISKSIRALQPQIEEKLVADDSKNAKAAAAVTEEVVDLGQYANTGVFEDNDKKKNKFARLMGGAKKEARVEEGHKQHSTFALTQDKLKNVEGELEKEFEMGRTHHGKKGLGAK